MLQVLTNNHFNGRAGYTPRWLILHGTAGGTSAQAIADYFKKTEGTPEPVSAHYVIGIDGEVIQCVDEQNAAYANGILEDGHDPWWTSAINPNYLTISIEHCKPSTDNSDVLTPAQEAASFTLVKDICTHWNIPMRKADAQGGITGHYSISPINRKFCPGPYPSDRLWTYLQKGTTMIPQGWKDDGTILTAPNGIPVIHGFRLHVLANNWDSANWPLEPEQGVPQLEMSNPALGGGTRQTFRWKRLEWTQSRDVFEAWIGPELLALSKMLSMQGAQPAANLEAAASTISAISATSTQLQAGLQAINKAAQQALTDLGK